jgi:hypothetical protein
MTDRISATLLEISHGGGLEEKSLPCEQIGRSLIYRDNRFLFQGIDPRSESLGDFEHGFLNIWNGSLSILGLPERCLGPGDKIPIRYHYLFLPSLEPCSWTKAGRDSRKNHARHALGSCQTGRRLKGLGSPHRDRVLETEVRLDRKVLQEPNNRFCALERFTWREIGAAETAQQ